MVVTLAVSWLTMISFPNISTGWNACLCLSWSLQLLSRILSPTYCPLFHRSSCVGIIRTFRLMLQLALAMPSIISLYRNFPRRAAHNRLLPLRLHHVILHLTDHSSKLAYLIPAIIN